MTETISPQIFAIIFEDNSESIQNISKILERDNQVRTAGLVQNENELIQLIQNEIPSFEHPILLLVNDMLFDRLSLEIVLKLSDYNLYTVIITANLDEAYILFRLKVNNYLQLPITSTKFQQILLDFKRYVLVYSLVDNFHQNYSYYQTLISDNIISIPSTNRIDLIKSESIIYIQSQGKYSSFILENKHSLLSCKNLGEYESILIPKNFIRVHHSYIVNSQHIKYIEKSHGWSCILSNDASIPISRRKHDEITARFQF